MFVARKIRANGALEPLMKLFDMFETYDGTSDAPTWIQRTKVISEIQNRKL